MTTKEPNRHSVEKTDREKKDFVTAPIARSPNNAKPQYTKTNTQSKDVRLGSTKKVTTSKENLGYKASSSSISINNNHPTNSSFTPMQYMHENSSTPITNSIGPAPVLQPAMYSRNYYSPTISTQQQMRRPQISVYNTPGNPSNVQLANSYPNIPQFQPSGAPGSQPNTVIAPAYQAYPPQYAPTIQYLVPIPSQSFHQSMPVNSNPVQHPQFSLINAVPSEPRPYHSQVQYFSGVRPQGVGVQQYPMTYQYTSTTNLAYQPMIQEAPYSRPNEGYHGQVYGNYNNNINNFPGMPRDSNQAIQSLGNRSNSTPNMSQQMGWRGSRSRSNSSINLNPHLTHHTGYMNNSSYFHMFKPLYSMSTQPGFPRGPPKKPLKTNFALWVGNLPQRKLDSGPACVIDKVVADSLTKLFKESNTSICREALYEGRLPSVSPSYNHLAALIEVFESKQLASVKYIEESGCAIVNFRDRETMEKMIEKCSVNDDANGTSKIVIGGRKLAVRMKKLDDESQLQSESINSPAAGHNNNNATLDLPRRQLTSINAITESPITTHDQVSSQSSGVDVYAEEEYEPGEPKDCFFIVKSLTYDDMITSVLLGVWSVQSHNIAKFNKFYREYDNVYLIFSANRSGEYFGYARMSEEVPKTKDDPKIRKIQEKIEKFSASQGRQDQNYQPPRFGPFQPKNEIPRIIYTPELPDLPSGRIVDDSARGGFFWEAYEWKKDDSNSPKHLETISTDSSSVSRTSSRTDSAISLSVSTTISEEEPQNSTFQLPSNWTYPFQIEWISPTLETLNNFPRKTVPFHKVADLRNKFNDNKEVKIARDGTRVAKRIGRIILKKFNDPLPSDIGIRRRSYNPENSNISYDRRYSNHGW